MSSFTSILFYLDSLFPKVWGFRLFNNFKDKTIFNITINCVILVYCSIYNVQPECHYIDFLSSFFFGEDLKK